MSYKQNIKKDLPPTLLVYLGFLSIVFLYDIKTSPYALTNKYFTHVYCDYNFNWDIYREQYMTFSISARVSSRDPHIKPRRSRGPIWVEG